MVKAGIAMQPWAFEVVARVSGNPSGIKAGAYEATAGATPLDLLDKITRGDFALTEIKFVEGWTFRQMREALDAHPDVRHEGKGLRRHGSPRANSAWRSLIPKDGFFPIRIDSRKARAISRSCAAPIARWRNDSMQRGHSGVPTFRCHRRTTR